MQEKINAALEKLTSPNSALADKVNALNALLAFSQEEKIMVSLGQNKTLLQQLYQNDIFRSFLSILMLHFIERNQIEHFQQMVQQLEPEQLSTVISELNPALTLDRRTTCSIIDYLLHDENQYKDFIKILKDHNILSTPTPPRMQP